MDGVTLNPNMNVNGRGGIVAPTDTSYGSGDNFGAPCGCPQEHAKPIKKCRKRKKLLKTYSEWKLEKCNV